MLPEPLHFDLVLEDEVVVDAIPQLGFIHRGLEALVKVKDIHTFVAVCERICGICAFGHSFGYCQTVEKLMGIEVPQRAEFLRVIWHELSRLHSHLLWLGLLADAFGFENLFMQFWREREKILAIFEQTTGGRVILSACVPGGVTQDISNSELQGIVQVLAGLEQSVRPLSDTILNDKSVRTRLEGIGYLSKEDAVKCGIVGPMARASGVVEDVRLLRKGAYAALSPEAISPVLFSEGDGLARCKVRVFELSQTIKMINEWVEQIPDGEIAVKVKGGPAAGNAVTFRLEQPRGECLYLAKGNGTPFLERFRIRTPTAQNVLSMVQMLQGCDLADVPINILTIDPCVSCTER